MAKKAAAIKNKIANQLKAENLGRLLTNKLHQVTACAGGSLSQDKLIANLDEKYRGKEQECLLESPGTGLGNS
jgi:hypothetical protein